MIETSEKIANAPRGNWDCHRPPGLVEMVRSCTHSHNHVSYVIWRNPWMIIQNDTFIADVLYRLGAEIKIVSPKKYPEVELESIRDSFLLFATEPFPFAKKISELQELDLEGAVVDGTHYSWFGAEAIQFMDSQLFKK
jgi:hypothetical protein